MNILPPPSEQKMRAEEYATPILGQKMAAGHI
jgi:hypothetical protein